MFRWLAGIDTEGAGFKRVIIRPGPPQAGSNPDRKPLDWVKAEYASIRGKIGVNWRMDGGQFEMELRIPANVTARVGVPATQPVTAQAGVVFREMKDGRAWLDVESGTYRIRAR